jgi:hypothetical protein
MTTNRCLIVSVVRASTGTFPTERSRGEDAEERRLFYVALTRSRKHLELTYRKRVRRWVGERGSTPIAVWTDFGGLERMSLCPRCEESPRASLASRALPVCGCLEGGRKPADPWFFHRLAAGLRPMRTTRGRLPSRRRSWTSCRPGPSSAPTPPPAPTAPLTPPPPRPPRRHARKVRPGPRSFTRRWDWPGCHHVGTIHHHGELCQTPVIEGRLFSQS